MTYEQLTEAIQNRNFAPVFHSPGVEITHEQGDITWYIGPLDDGRWWTYDDLEPGDRIVLHASEADARAYDAECWAIAREQENEWLDDQNA